MQRYLQFWNCITNLPTDCYYVLHDLRFIFLWHRPEQFFELINYRPFKYYIVTLDHKASHK